MQTNKRIECIDTFAYSNDAIVQWVKPTFHQISQHMQIKARINRNKKKSLICVGNSTHN